MGQLALSGRRFRLVAGETIFTIDYARGEWVFFHAPWEHAAQRRQPIDWFASKVRDRQVSGVYPESERLFSVQMNWHFRRALERAADRTS